MVASWASPGATCGVSSLRQAKPAIRFAALLGLAQRRPADLLAEDFPRDEGGAGKSPASSSIRMARGCQYYCPQGGEVVAQVPNCVAFPLRLAQPRWAGEIIKCEIWESWCFAPRWLAVRQVLLT